MTHQDEKEYLTPDEASRYTGVTRRTLDRYADQGRLNRYRRGITRSVFFKRSELDKLLEYRPDEQEED